MGEAGSVWRITKGERSREVEKLQDHKLQIEDFFQVKNIELGDGWDITIFYTTVKTKSKIKVCSKHPALCYSSEACIKIP